MPIYNTEELKKYCQENKIELLENYDKKATSKTFIEGKCLTENCNENFRKFFSGLLTAGGYCRNCTLNNGNIKRKETNLQRYGVDSVFKVKEIKEKIKKKCVEKYGIDSISKVNDIKEKRKKTNLFRYGVEFPLQNLDLQKKKGNTCLERFGIEHAMKDNKFKEKREQTCLKRYGCRNVMQNEEVKNKYKQNLNLQEKREQTCLTKYGCRSVMQNEEIKNKYKQSCLINFGYESPLQNPEISEKMFKSCHLLKDYTLPSKKVIQMQGYENFGMDELLFIEKIDENDIIISRKKVPEIWYKDKDGKQHRYFVDFYIPHQKRCIEIKSTWTLKKDNVFEKQQAMKDAGYQCEIWVFDDKGNKLECYK